MNTLIIYASRYGTTEKCARILKDKLDDPVEIVNVNRSKAIDLNGYDRIILGSSVYMGKASKELNKFIMQHWNRLGGKELGLFICCSGMEKMKPKF